jgi:hypothetical protein
LPLSPDGNQYTAQDAPGALLPNGNVLFAARWTDLPGNFTNGPIAFFEFDGHQLLPAPNIPNPKNFISQSINLLVLPTGQVLATTYTNDIEIYTPAAYAHSSSWQPVILSAPDSVKPGRTYTLCGARLNGMSQASMFGDEGQDATNYPLVRITNNKTKHVFYSRTHDHSSMAVASNDVSSTHFDVPEGQESGPSKLEVVANGIASVPYSVNVR